MGYRYILDKRSGQEYKHICPLCNEKDFVRYVDTQTMQYIADEVGQCNRLKECGYHYSPKEYAQSNPQYSALTPNPKKDVPNFLKKRMEPSFIDFGLVKQSMANKRFLNNFTRWLYSVMEKNPEYGLEALQSLIIKYRLGGADKMKGAVIFWQIDINGKVRTGKIVRYNSQTGKRERGNWVHACLKKQQKVSEDFNMVQCLFGEHLLKKYPDAICAVFESEKTAIVVSILYPNLICLATGGLSNLNARKCKSLRNRRVIFFPDLGYYSVWKEKVEEIAQKVFFQHYHVDDVLEKNATKEEKEQGLNLCDYIVRALASSQTK